jgi:hypothetical protein
MTRAKKVAMSSPRRRIETDVMKLLMSDYEVTLVNDNMQGILHSYRILCSFPGSRRQ